MKHLYRSLLRRMVRPRTLSRINHLSHVDDRLNEVEAARARLAEIVLRERNPSLFASDLPDAREFSIFSQNGEDGILLWLLEQSGAPEKTFVEIGVENARECNTALLGFVLGWNGLMVDADPLGADAARRFAANMLRRKPNRVEIRQEFVTAENINRVITEAGFQGQLGVLSIDVDGVDYWLWKALTEVSPRVVVIEYNASFGAEASITVPYKPDFDCRREHPSGYYHGASLAALEKLGRELGYVLVAVDFRGVNAFFLRKDNCPPALDGKTAAELFRPHFERSKTVPPQDQWAAIQDLPFVSV